MDYFNTLFTVELTEFTMYFFRGWKCTKTWRILVFPDSFWDIAFRIAGLSSLINHSNLPERTSINENIIWFKAWDEGKNSFIHLMFWFLLWLSQIFSQTTTFRSCRDWVVEPLNHQDDKPKISEHSIQLAWERQKGERDEKFSLNVVDKLHSGRDQRTHFVHKIEFHYVLNFPSQI